MNRNYSRSPKPSAIEDFTAEQRPGIKRLSMNNAGAWRTDKESFRPQPWRVDMRLFYTIEAATPASGRVVGYPEAVNTSVSSAARTLGAIGPSSGHRVIGTCGHFLEEVLRRRRSPTREDRPADAKAGFCGLSQAIELSRRTAYRRRLWSRRLPPAGAHAN